MDEISRNIMRNNNLDIEYSNKLSNHECVVRKKREKLILGVTFWFNKYKKAASVGLEPTIFSLEGRRSIHFATGL